MNALTSTRVFPLMNKLFNITQVLSSQTVIDEFTVDKEMYSNYVQNIKSFRFPLVKQIVNSLNNGTIRPILFADSKLEEDKSLMFPTSITGFIRMNKNGPVSYMDVSSKGSYLRNKLTKEIEFFKIDDRSFYCFMQMAFITMVLHKNSNSLSANQKFLKCICESYSYMLTRCISALYPVSANKADEEVLRYITKVFCLQNFFQMSQDNAKITAYNFQSTDKGVISNNCNYFIYYDKIKEQGDIYDMSTVDTKNDLYPIDKYLNIISEEFTYIKNGKIKFRNVLNRYTSMYGQNSVLTLEHSSSFINMLLASTLKIGLYNDLMIDKNLGVYIDELYKIIGMITG